MCLQGHGFCTKRGIIGSGALHSVLVGAWVLHSDSIQCAAQGSTDLIAMSGPWQQHPYPHGGYDQPPPGSNQPTPPMMVPAGQPPMMAPAGPYAMPPYHPTGQYAAPPAYYPGRLAPCMQLNRVRYAIRAGPLCTTSRSANYGS